MMLQICQQTSFGHLNCAVHVPNTGKELSKRMTLTDRKNLQAQNKTDKKVHFLISLLLFPLP